MTPIRINWDYFRFLTFIDRSIFIIYIYFNILVLRWFHLAFVLEWRQQDRDRRTQSKFWTINYGPWLIRFSKYSDIRWTFLKGRKRLKKNLQRMKNWRKRRKKRKEESRRILNLSPILEKVSDSDFLPSRFWSLFYFYVMVIS